MAGMATLMTEVVAGQEKMKVAAVGGKFHQYQVYARL